MKKTKKYPQFYNAAVKRVNPDIKEGLTSEQVKLRVENGAVNTQKQGLTPTVSSILRKNTFTLFNFIMVFLAVAIVLVGYPENILFIGIAIANTFIGIIQELRSKRSLDKLSVLVKARVKVVRDSKIVPISQEQLVLDDIVVLAAGNQVCADAEVVRSDGLEVDESLLTGESDRIRKEDGDDVLSGSYIAGGRGFARVIAVGEASYAHSLTSEAKQSKKKTPRLLMILNRIILVLTIVIIPLGAILFIVSFFMQGEPIETAVLGTTASLVGMIPAGLILLTSITMTVGALKLARRKALVQSLPGIETLARTDVLCLDKTGTITDGTFLFEGMEIFNELTEEDVSIAISELMGAVEDSNATALALVEAFGKTGDWKTGTVVPFSSERKWSGASFTKKGSLIIGSPGMIFAGYEDDEALIRANELASEGYRVLCLAGSAEDIKNEKLPGELFCAALLILSDNVREGAAETFRYFADEGVTIKVISGDNPRTVSVVAETAGIENAGDFIDMNKMGNNTDYASVAEKYTVFGNVTPQQKRELIRGLKANGHTACMTGDGVNDILAMRESDCSVAMVGGSDAARSACDFVLMTDDFGAMADVLKEGRRVINNIIKVVAIFLLQTTYSVLLTLIYVFIPYPYPFIPLQLTPVNQLTVGIPSFFIALRANYAKPKDMLVNNILEHTMPAAITIIFNTMYIQIAGILFDLTPAETSTMIVFLIGVVGFYMMFRLARPFTPGLKVMLALLIVGFVGIFTVLGDFFSFTNLLNRNIFFYVPLVYFSYHVHEFLGKNCTRALDAHRILKEAGWMKSRKK